MDQIHQMPSRQISLACLTAEQGCAAPCVEEQVFAFGNILDVNLTATVHSCEDALSLLAERVSPAGLGVWHWPLTLLASEAAGSTAG